MNDTKIIETLEYIKTFEEQSYGANKIALDKAIEAIKFNSRARVLLDACAKLFNKQNESFYVLNLLEETVYYDECDCDGNCLWEDIVYLLECGE